MRRSCWRRRRRTSRIPRSAISFVQTELVPGRQAIYCTRRPRSAEEQPPWMTHMMMVRGITIGEPSYETDRMRFIGRQRTLASPQRARWQIAPFQHRRAGPRSDRLHPPDSVDLQPNEAVRIDIVTGVAESRAGVEALTEKYSDSSLADRVFDLAWTHGQILLQQLERFRSGCAGLWPPGGFDHLCLVAQAGQGQHSQPQSTGTIGALGLWNLGRFADCIGADSRP